MKRLLGRIVGTRPELKLRQRWWHRLLLVAMWPAVALGFLWSIVFLNGVVTPPGIHRNEVNVLTDLESFTLAHPELSNAIPAFLDSPGMSGTVSSTGEVGVLWDSDLRKGVCSATFAEHSSDIAKSVAKAYGDPVSETSLDIRLFLEKTNGHEVHCLTVAPFTNAAVFDSSNVIKYETRWTVTAWRLLVLLSVTTLLIFAISTSIAFLYYRIVIYVIFGPKHAQTAA